MSIVSDLLIDGDYDDTVAAAASAATATGSQLIADTSADPASPAPRWVIDGYGTLFAELTDRLEEPADIVLVPIPTATRRSPTGVPG